MLVPGVEEFLLERVVDRIAQVDARNLRAERGRELPHREGGGFLVQGGGGRFHHYLLPALLFCRTCPAERILGPKYTGKSQPHKS